MADALRPLIEAAKKGDRDALNDLAGCVDRFQRIFSGSISRHLRRSQGSTIDFVLEGVAEALADLDKFEYLSDEQFYGWISKTIRSRMVDAWRHEGRQKRAGRPVAIGESDLHPPSDDPTSSRVVSDRELKLEVGRIVLQMQVEHPREMEVVVLKVFEGLSWAGIRDELGLTSDRVGRTLFAKGIDRLRPLLRESLGQDALNAVLGG
jgi:RNA polymerase sigma factor (sigma-70 family)